VRRKVIHTAEKTRLPEYGSGANLKNSARGGNAGGIAASPDGRFIFVANNSDNTVSVIEAVAVSI
jgi:DNA-binding beta-propeller fold protein YncE